MQFWPFTRRGSDMNGRAARSRLSEVEKELEALQAKAKELSADVERTKSELVRAANGTYVKVREMLDGTRNKG